MLAAILASATALNFGLKTKNFLVFSLTLLLCLPLYAYVVVGTQSVLQTMSVQQVFSDILSVSWQVISEPFRIQAEHYDPMLVILGLVVILSAVLGTIQMCKKRN